MRLGHLEQSGLLLHIVFLQQALGQDPQLPVPTCDCIIWDAMSGKPRRRQAEQSTLQPSFSGAPTISSKNLGSLFTHTASLSSLFHHFTAVRGLSAASWGGKSRGKAQSPAHAYPASVLRRLFHPSCPSELLHSLSGTRTGSQGLLAVRNTRQV